MKVLLVNGSIHQSGATNRALSEVASALESQGIGAEIVWVGSKPISDCLACGGCSKIGKCVVDDIVNELAIKAAESDGFVFGSPVYYAHPSARLLAVMDRLFFSAGKRLAHKPAAAVVNARRGGNSASFDAINKHFTINQMPVVSSTYWNMSHGNNVSEIEQDEEGLDTMKNIGLNMAWLLKCIEAGKNSGIQPPAPTVRKTNFIR